jgi:rod shape-determining protein MreC
MIKFIRLIILILIVGFVAYYAPFQNMVHDISCWLMYPVFVVQRHIVDPIQRYNQRRHLTQDIVNKYQQLFVRYENIINEQTKLLAYLDTIQSNQWLNEYQHRYDGIICMGQILSKLMSDDNHSFILDVGLRQGVERDMVAIYKNCLVGRVVEVFPSMCRVALITDQASAVPVWCAQTKSQGIMKGTGHNDMLELHYVNHLDALLKDDVVISHGEGLIYPKGLCIGFVQDWQLDGFFYKATIKPAVDLEELSYCALVSKGSSFTE